MGICSPRERKTDVIQKCFTPACGTADTIWTSSGLLNPCATVIFTVAEACTTATVAQPVDFVVNKKAGNPTTFTLEQGESRALTVDQIDSIDVTCNGTTGQCIIDLCMLLHYECCS